MTDLKVNGKKHRLEMDPETPLLWVLRDHLGLTGTKYSCGIGECGACAVQMDGEVVQSCTVSLAEAAGKSVITIEGLNSPQGMALKNAWQKESVAQCGYCQPGQIITAASLLERVPDPDEQEIKEAMNGVLCRCGTYQAIGRAVKRAAKEVGS